MKKLIVTCFMYEEANCYVFHEKIIVTCFMKKRIVTCFMKKLFVTFRVACLTGLSNVRLASGCYEPGRAWPGPCL